MERAKILRIASITSILGNLILAVSKIVVGLMAGSLAVLGDGLDSLTDIFISIITLAVSIIITRPPDKEHPYGHFRAETIATSILAFIIFFIGGQLALSAMDKLMYHNSFTMPEPIAVYVTLFSIVGKILLSFSQYKFGKKAESAMLIANSKNMLNDVITSTSVLIGLACVFFFKLPAVDKILAILIGLWIMFSAVRIFKGIITELMEGEDNQEVYDKIFQAVDQIGENFNPHRVRIRKIGAMYVVELDIEIDGSLSVKEAHLMTQEIERKIREMIPNLYDVMIHVEPIGNFEEEEPYGLCIKDIKTVQLKK